MINEHEDQLTLVGKVIKLIECRDRMGEAYQQVLIKQIRNKYQNLIVIPLFRERIDTVNVNDQVYIHLCIEAGLSFSGDRYRNRLSAWKIEKI